MITELSLVKTYGVTMTKGRRELTFDELYELIEADNMLSSFHLIHKYGVAMTRAQVAETLEITEDTVKALTRSGQLPLALHGNRRDGDVYSSAAIGKWIDRALEVAA